LRELPSVSGGDPKGSHGPGRARGMGERLWAGMWRVARPLHCSTWSQMSFRPSELEEPIAAQGSEHPADTRGLASDPRTGGHADAPDVSGQRDALERELSRKATAHACPRITTDAYLLGPRAHQPAEWADAGERATLVRAIYRRIIVEGACFDGGTDGGGKARPDRRTPSDRGFGAPGESRAQGSHTGPLRVVNFESYESRFQKDRGWRPWVAQHVWRPLLLGGGHGSEELHRRDACRLVALLTARGSAWLWSRRIRGNAHRRLAPVAGNPDSCAMVALVARPMRRSRSW
jgi:hypothetical protein